MTKLPWISIVGECWCTIDGDFVDSDAAESSVWCERDWSEPIRCVGSSAACFTNGLSCGGASAHLVDAIDVDVPPDLLILPGAACCDGVRFVCLRSSELDHSD